MEVLEDCSAPLRAFGRFSDAPLIHDLAQIGGGSCLQDKLVRVRGARVVCANYRALLHDFPHVFSLEARRRKPLSGCDACAESGKLCVKAVNSWLVRNAAFISLQQLQPNEVNSTIPICAHEVRLGYRPPEYGRAAVVSVDGEVAVGQTRFLDLKGVGVAPGKTPSHKPHSSGLEYLGTALVDFFFGWLVDTIFARTCPGYHVLPVYAVLDLGFDVVGGAIGTAPAGLQVRRAHARPSPLIPLSGSAHEKLMIHVEMLLRLFGLTTSNYLTSYRLEDGHKPQLFCSGRAVSVVSETEHEKASRIIEAVRASGAGCLDVMNVQMTDGGDWERKKLDLLDFGHMRSQRRFTAPLANPLRDGALRVGRITPVNHPSFVQPDQAISIDTDLCDRESANAYGFYTAAKFRHLPKHCSQRTVETILRLARLKVMQRGLEWARRKVENA